ncbi:MAG TPA: PEGA domain-containing protein [Pyrinomonadaceae bacterium]|jgi:hypothetical protein
MKKILSLTLLFIMAVTPLAGFSQEKSKNKSDNKTAGKSQTAPAEAVPAPKPMSTFGLSEDTPIRLRLNRTISSGTEKLDDKVDFTVVEDVKVGDLVVVPQGATAIGTVTEAKPKGRLGRSGKLNVNIDYVQLATGDKVALHSVKGGKGGSRTGAMTGAMVATGILFFPAAPLFLFMKGKNITIAKGTEITAYVAADTPLDQAKFVNRPEAGSMMAANQTQPGESSAATDLSTIVVKSSPEGAEISIDGKFVGSTPSTLRLASGEHNIVIEKSGFKSWQRTMTVNTSGSVTVDATLEKAE